MIWVILFIPLGLYASLCVLSGATAITMELIFIVVVLFTYVEIKQVQKDKNRTKNILWILILMLVFLCINVALRF
jgi:hypothetical protein